MFDMLNLYCEKRNPSKKFKSVTIFAPFYLHGKLTELLFQIQNKKNKDKPYGGAATHYSLARPRLHVPHPDGGVERPRDDVGAVELQRVDAVGVTGEGVQALLSGGVPNLCTFEKGKEAIRIILQGKGGESILAKWLIRWDEYNEEETPPIRQKPINCFPYDTEFRTNYV